jgi:hypothetical protein
MLLWQQTIQTAEKSIEQHLINFITNFVSGFSALVFSRPVAQSIVYLYQTSERM